MLGHYHGHLAEIYKEPVGRLLFFISSSFTASSSLQHKPKHQFSAQSSNSNNLKMFTKTFLATAVAGLAAAAPVARQTVQEFAMIATHSASAVHLQSINANGGKFWVGASKPTASFCPLDASQCPGLFPSLSPSSISY